MAKIACAVDEIKSLPYGEIKTILDRDNKGEFLVLDVRQPEEYEAGHIPGAMLIPLGELEARQGELVENPDAKTLLHELALEERNHANTLMKWVAEIVRR